MAHLPEEEIQSIVRERGLPKLCNNTITNPHVLKIELAKIREQGYAQSKEETDMDAWGVAVPVYDEEGKVIAGLGIAGPISRFREELAKNHIKSCEEAANRITSMLGKSK